MTKITGQKPICQPHIHYNLENIFIADEFGLFYEMLPTKTMHLKS